ncbi:MAG: hypothetical protein ABFS56_01345 [Pseudomonadota bacterium]
MPSFPLALLDDGTILAGSDDAIHHRTTGTLFDRRLPERHCAIILAWTRIPSA